MKPHKQLFYEYTAMYRPYLNQLNAQLSSFNLSSAQWSVLHFIVHNGPHTISDISLYKQVEKPTITKMVQKLMELGIVETRSEQDKRIKMIQLTEHGNEICGLVKKKLDGFQSSLLEDVSKDDQLLVARVMRNISEKISSNKG